MVWEYHYYCSQKLCWRWIRRIVYLQVLIIFVQPSPVAFAFIKPLPSPLDGVVIILLAGPKKRFSSNFNLLASILVKLHFQPFLLPNPIYGQILPKNLITIIFRSTWIFCVWKPVFKLSYYIRWEPLVVRHVAITNPEPNPTQFSPNSFENLAVFQKDGNKPKVCPEYILGFSSRLHFENNIKKMHFIELMHIQTALFSKGAFIFWPGVKKHFIFIWTKFWNIPKNLRIFSMAPIASF